MRRSPTRHRLARIRIFRSSTTTSFPRRRVPPRREIANRRAAALASSAGGCNRKRKTPGVAAGGYRSTLAKSPRNRRHRKDLILQPIPGRARTRGSSRRDAVKDSHQGEISRLCQDDLIGRQRRRVLQSCAQVFSHKPRIGSEQLFKRTRRPPSSQAADRPEFGCP